MRTMLCGLLLIAVGCLGEGEEGLEGTWVYTAGEGQEISTISFGADSSFRYAEQVISDDLFEGQYAVSGNRFFAKGQSRVGAETRTLSFALDGDRLALAAAHRTSGEPGQLVGTYLSLVAVSNRDGDELGGYELELGADGRYERRLLSGELETGDWEFSDGVVLLYFSETGATEYEFIDDSIGNFRWIRQP